jgi:hypothetical protein
MDVLPFYEYAIGARRTRLFRSSTDYDTRLSSSRGVLCSVCLGGDGQETFLLTTDRPEDYRVLEANVAQPRVTLTLYRSSPLVGLERTGREVPR